VQVTKNASGDIKIVITSKNRVTIIVRSTGYDRDF